MTYEVSPHSLIKSYFGRVGLGGYLMRLLTLQMGKQQGVLPVPKQRVPKEQELTMGYGLCYNTLMRSLRSFTDVLSRNTATKVFLKVSLDVHIARNSELQKNYIFYDSCRFSQKNWSEHRVSIYPPPLPQPPPAIRILYRSVHLWFVVIYEAVLTRCHIWSPYIRVYSRCCTFYVYLKPR